jgi:DNA-binding CsgD family transcriptional regulator/tetratricopeptide (TPR) repeat protein
VAGARAAVLTRPELSVRLAERALDDDPGPGAAVALAAAHAELGNMEAARHAHGVAATRLRNDDDRFTLRLDELAFTTFSERRPDRALARIAELRHELPPRFAVELDSTAALVTMFATRSADALAMADRALLVTDQRIASIARARTARIAGLAHSDRTAEAIRASDELLEFVASKNAGAYAQGLAHALSALARLANWDDRTTGTDPASGRWPVPPPEDGDRWTEAVSWPLVEGARRLFEGRYAAAAPRLREALVQQRRGEGLFRSEAVTLLAVCLAASGAVDEAEALLDEVPPDRLAVYPGLGAWAAAAVDAARGRPSAIDHAFIASAEARDAGSVMSAVAYLAFAANLGASGRAGEELDRLGHDPIAPITAARAVGIRARATGDGRALLAAAERHADLGLVGPAAEFADLAVAALGRGPARVRDRAQAFASEMRRRRKAGLSGTEPVLPLTRRELEVARLAANGMTDRDIAATLVVSVRTVESHLAACYRKLDISSRQGLRTVLRAGA